MPTNDEIKKVLDKIEPLLVKLDEITGKDNLLITAENMQRTEAITRACTAKQIFAELDNLHVVENWSTKKGKGIPLLLKQIGAYKAVKKKYGVD